MQSPPAAPRDRISRIGTLVETHEVARDTVHYTLDLDAPLAFEAGQFVNVAVPSAQPRGERSYSVWSDPGQSMRLEFVIKLLPGGAASEMLRSIHVGAILPLRGPFGAFTLRPDDAPIQLVATGTGLAPFHSMLSVAVRRRDARRIRLWFGVRSQPDLFAADALEGFKRDLPDFDYSVCLSRPEPGWKGYVGRVTHRLEAEGAHPEAHYYLCGNGEMTQEAKVYLKAHGVDRRHIHVESYY